MIYENEFDLSHSLADPFTSKETLNLDKDKMLHKVEAFFMNLQGELTKAFENLENGAKFKIERIAQDNNCGEIIAILEDGEVFERASTYFTLMKDRLPPTVAKMMREKSNFADYAWTEFTTVNISAVIHPRNPHVPTMELNYRYFEVKDPLSGYSEWWFGGVSDLTPNFVVDADIKHFHSTLKDASDTSDTTFYPKFKQECDKYFYNVHRKEHRGVGGIFFDDMDAPSHEKVFDLVKALGNAALPSYLPLIEKNMFKEYTSKERDWQLLRRGRHVEFILVYDRGTKFSLQMPNAPVESILMSLPLHSKWNYKYVPKEDTEEAKLVEVLKRPREWI